MLRSWKLLFRLPILLMMAAVPVAGAETPPVTVLLYHRLGSTVADPMTVKTSTFEQQLAMLRDQGYTIVPLRSVVGRLEGSSTVLPPRAVAIVADDGHRSVYTEMWPIIRSRRVPVTLFIYPSAISNASYALSWEQIAEMTSSGLVDVQSHTFWHPNFNHERARLAPDAFRAFVMMQLTKSKEVLERRTGSAVDLLAWPFGIHDPELEELARQAGYRAAFTLERRPLGGKTDLLALPRYLITEQDRGARFEQILQGDVR